MESAAALQRSENAQLAAQTARAQARAVLGRALRLRRSSREVSALAARSSAVGAAVQAAFAALLAPAALLDESGEVLAINPAWRACDAVNEAIAVGTAFGPTWTLLTGDAFVQDAVASVIRTSAPIQVETTTRGVDVRRLLMQVGPAELPSGGGALVVLIDTTEQYERERQLLYDATHDQLTGLANRLWLQRAVEDARERLRRYDEPFALLYLDLDDFKPLNDRFGHAVGDGILREVAIRWNRVVRAPDLLARVGGDEFVVVVQHAVSPSAEVLAARLSAALDESFAAGAHGVVVSVTIGVSVPSVTASPEDALALADRAMYESKRRMQLARRPRLPRPRTASSAV